MAKENILKGVKARMKELRDVKAEEMETIRQKQDEARGKIEAAGLAMKTATEAMDVDGYERAKNDKRRARTALDMYDARAAQLTKKELISEEESDKIIDSLLAYEEDLAVIYRDAVAEVLRKLAEVHEAYTSEISDVEDTIKIWERDIHPNHSTRGRSLYLDESTGQYSDRSKTPVPVRVTPYTGCSEAQVIDEFLCQRVTRKIFEKSVEE